MGAPMATMLACLGTCRLSLLCKALMVGFIRCASGSAGEAGRPAGGLGSEAEGNLPSSWQGVCDWVLGQHTSLWGTIFQAAFLQARPPSCGEPSLVCLCCTLWKGPQAAGCMACPARVIACHSAPGAAAPPAQRTAHCCMHDTPCARSMGRR